LDYVKTEEFGYLFEQTFRGVLEEYAGEKLFVLKSMLLNSMVRGDVKQETKEYMLSVVRSLSVIHLRVLGMLDNPALYYQSRGLQDGGMAIGGSRMAELRKCFPDYDESVIRAVWSDLYRYGLVVASELGTMISSSGSRALQGLITPFGQLLIAFIKKP
jgi:hypothetical protein